MQKIDVKLSGRIANMGLICACLVVGIHLGDCDVVGSPTWWLIRMMKGGLCSIAVPFFFIVSGFMLAGHFNECDWWKKALIKRARTLLVPFLIWNLLWVVFDCTLTMAANLKSGADLFRDVQWNGFLWLAGLDVTGHPPLFTYWYVRALLILVVASPLLMWMLVKTRGWMLVLFWCVYAGLVPGDDGGDIPGWKLFFKWTFSLLGVFYFSVGLWLRQRGLSWLQTTCRNKSWRMGFLLVMGGLGLCAFKIYWAANGLGTWSILRPIAIPILMIGIWLLTPSCVWPKSVVTLAFPIYTLHVFVRTCGWILIPNMTASILGYLSFWVATILGCGLISFLIGRLPDRLGILLWGGR